MFGALSVIVGLLQTGASAFPAIMQHKADKERKLVALNLLRLYYLLKDCVDEGSALISEAGPDPVDKIKSMDQQTSTETIERWEAILRRQFSRLSHTYGIISDDSLLSIINPELRNKIDDVIGSKWDKVNSLHGIMAALTFGPLPGSSNEERAGYISLISGSEGDFIDIPKVRREMDELRDALERYRNVINCLLAPEEIVRLSDQAREQSRFADE